LKKLVNLVKKTLTNSKPEHILDNALKALSFIFEVNYRHEKRRQGADGPGDREVSADEAYDDIPPGFFRQASRIQDRFALALSEKNDQYMDRGAREY